MNTPALPPAIETPALWNPNAAACWSLLFSPAFGAYLHAGNADALGREHEAKANRVWFYASIAYFIFAMVTMFVPAIPDRLFNWVAIALLLGWYFSIGKRQIDHVKEQWRDNYVRKPWTMPLLIAFACLIGLVVVFYALAVVEGSVSGSQ
jgi:cation transport ATPase